MYKKQLYSPFKIIYHDSTAKHKPLQAARTLRAFPRTKTMTFLKRHLPKFFLAASVLLLIGGLLAGEQNMFFTYAIVICLSCIGIG